MVDEDDEHLSIPTIRSGMAELKVRPVLLSFSAERSPSELTRFYGIELGMGVWTDTGIHLFRHTCL